MGLLVGCSANKTEEKPATILPKEKVISVLIDLQVLESHFQRTFKRQELYRDALDSSSQSIFESHQISKVQFDSAFNYYAGNPDTLYLIYEAALDSINYKIDGGQ